MLSLRRMEDYLTEVPERRGLFDFPVFSGRKGRYMGSEAHSSGSGQACAGRRVSCGGFTLVEAVMSIAVVAIVLLVMVSLSVIVLRFIEFGRMRVAAATLANEKMEVLRNMPYDSLATKGGAIYPPGNLSDDEIATKSGFTFNVNTVIAYVDDPYDGNFSGTIPGKPIDIYPYDYKKAQLIITEAGKNSVIVKVATNISAKAAETPTNTGILAVTVLNATGNPFNSAVVRINNPLVSPPVNITTTTDASGLVMIPMLPPDQGFNYYMRASYGDYSIDQTYPPTVDFPNPVNSNANIIAQQVTYKTLSIDQKGTLVVDTVDTNNSSIPNVTLLIEGDKKTYVNPDLYKTQAYATSSALGHLVIPDLEWDSYSITSPSTYYICSTSPYQKIALSPAASVSATLMMSSSPSNPRIYTVTPTYGSGVTTLTITGLNFSPGLDLRLKKTGDTDIIPTSMLISPSQDTITATFDFTGKTVGDWDILIVNPDTAKCLQKGGMAVQ